MSVYDMNTLKAFADYLDTHEVAKLHLGAGTNYVEGWLNTDLNPFEDKIFPLDMLKLPYIFEDNTFDYIYSEHNFEHFGLPELSGVIQECLRILKPNGIIRIATPDLERLISFYTDNQEDGNNYCEWALQKFVPFAVINNMHHKSIVLNNAFRNWGHQFIFDFETLSDLLKLCGFREVVRCPFCKSEHKDLADLEFHRYVVGQYYNELETMVVEAKK